MGIPIRDKMHYGLIGMPLGHSLSPFIHAQLQKCAGIVGDYNLIEIEKEKLESRFKNELLKLDGFNVTIPYKTDIIPFLDSLSNRAELFGAVNTVDIKSGKAKGYNTDCIGFVRAIGNSDAELAGNVLILGCGGVARMFACESAIAGAEVALAVRKQSFEKAEKLSVELKTKLSSDIKIADINTVNGSYDLIINATPVGMYPNTDESPVSEDVIKNASAVFDAIYNPLETKLIKTAKENGKKYMNGLPMLVWQAAAAEEIWNDIEFSSEDIDYVIKLSEERLRDE